MKSNPVAAVGIAFVDLPLPIEPHLLFRISCAEMESGTGAALARLTVAQVHPSRFTRGQLLEARRSGTARFFPSISSRPHLRSHWPVSSIAVEPLPKNGSGGPVPTLVPLWRVRQKSPVSRPR